MISAVELAESFMSYFYEEWYSLADPVPADAEITSSEGIVRSRSGMQLNGDATLKASLIYREIMGIGPEIVKDGPWTNVHELDTSEAELKVLAVRQARVINYQARRRLFGATAVKFFHPLTVPSIVLMDPALSLSFAKFWIRYECTAI